MTADIFWRANYEPGDLVCIGSDKENFLVALVISHKRDDKTYFVRMQDVIFKLHHDCIMGKYLSEHEKLKNLEGHMTKLLISLQTCAINNQKLRNENKDLREKLIELEVKYEGLEKHGARMIKHILDFYCKR